MRSAVGGCVLGMLGATWLACERFTEHERAGSAEMEVPQPLERDEGSPGSPAMAEREGVSPEISAPVVGEFALVPTGTMLRIRPDPEAPVWALVPATPVAEDEPWQVFSIRGTSGNFVEVESIDGDLGNQHCAPTSPALSGLRLVFFVEAEKLAPVTRRSTVLHFEDGTTVTLASGVPLHRQSSTHGSARSRVDAGGVRLEVDLDPSVVGRSYQLERGFVVGRRKGRTVANPTLRYDGGRRVQGVLGLDGGDAWVSIFARETRSEQELLTVGNRCLELRVFAERSEVDERTPTYAPPRAASAPPRAFSTDIAAWGASHRVDPGVAVYTEDGHRIGETLSPLGFSGHADESGKMRCFRAATDLNLCFLAEEVQRGTKIGTALGSKKPSTVSSNRRPRVRLEVAQISGYFPRELVLRVLRRADRDITACYEDRLRTHRRLSGAFTLELAIEPSGRAAASYAADQIVDETVARCIAERLEAITFPWGEAPTSAEIRVSLTRR